MKAAVEYCHVHGFNQYDSKCSCKTLTCYLCPTKRFLHLKDLWSC